MANRVHRSRHTPGDTFGTLVRRRQAVSLPLIEKKIEQVIASASPSDCFTDKSVDPQKFVALAAIVIAYEGDELALREVSKLVRLDEQRFGPLVGRTLQEAEHHRPGNPFLLAYRGFELGDPSVDRGIANWAEAQLGDKMPGLLGGGKVLRWDPIPEARVRQIRDWWAEAMIGRYGGLPTEDEWRRDPIVSRLRPSQADLLHNDMIRRMLETIERLQKH